MQVHYPTPNSGPERYLVITAGTLTLDSVILEAVITATHGVDSNKYVYGIQQTGGTVTVKGEAAQVRNFAHAVEITGGTFTMEEGSICENYIDGGASGVEIKSNGTFILNGGSIKDNKATNHVGVSLTDNNAKFTMTGGEISGNRAYCFGGGISAHGGTVEISGGTINNNHAAEGPYYQSGSTVDVGGGGIYINGGTVNFKGGTIKDNFLDGADKNCGAGVFVEGGGTFKMTDGTITGCKTNPDISSPQQSKGGGVFVKDGTFTMYGGTVSGNTVTASEVTPGYALAAGGGVYVQKGTFTMSAGKVSGNTADKGGGIYGEQSGYDLGVIKISGGEVSGNTATSIYTAGGGIYSKYQLTVSDSAQIKDNNAPSGEGGGIIIPHGGKFYFTGGTVSGNTAKKGNGIYISTTTVNTNPMEMSGSATVTEDNDVFLDKDTWGIVHIFVTGQLDNPHAARLTPKTYNDNAQVLKGTPALLNSEHGKFTVTPEVTGGTTKQWEVGGDGKLKTK